MVPQRAPQAQDRQTLQREDYERLIDDDVWAFIRRTDACFPPEAVRLPVARQREI